MYVKLVKEPRCVCVCVCAKPGELEVFICIIIGIIDQPGRQVISKVPQGYQNYPYSGKP